jgi:hypothetical protein
MGSSYLARAADPIPVKRLPGPLYALLACAIALGPAAVRYVLSDPIVDAAGTRQEIPQPPPKPRHATERSGPASDGGRVIVRRSGDWVWVWIESEPTSHCRPGGSLANGYVHAESPPKVRHDGSFEFRGEIWNTYRVTQKRRQLPHKLNNQPFQINYRIRGRFHASGVARGTLERRDRIHYDGGVAQDCRRSSTWVARHPAGDR